MFEDFLREHIQELIECSIDEYDIKEEDMDDIIYKVNNEHLWDMIDSTIYEVIDKYIVEEE